MVKDQEIKRLDVRSDWPIQLKFKGFKEHLIPILILFILIIMIYSNSFYVSWHFDDYINIVNNSAVHIKSLTWAELEKSMFGIADSGRWSRPLAYVSFALNYYFYGLNVFGYHVVNIIIHCLCAILLYIFIYNTLLLPIFKDRYIEKARSIALLAAALWAINPVQVAAVSYIVQRMTIMTALFYILSMLFYLKGRTAEQTGKRWLYLVVSLIMGVLSFGVKENAAMLPISLFFFDLILIQGFTPANIKKNLKFVILVTLITLSIGFIYFKDIDSIIGDYSIRPFTAWERVLTEPRVILFYISLLLYPITQRLTLIYDFEISKSLIDPWTTVISITIIMVMVFFAFLKARRWPLISYCVLFFFLNHVIEGSFISLELIFIHRNYLPSLLFFLPMSILFVEGLNKCNQRRFLCLFYSSAMVAFIILQGVTVYIQNNIWQNEISLWSDNAEKMPRVHHVRQNLATAYFMAGQTTEAFKELNMALQSYTSADITKKARTHGLLGEYYYLKRDYNKALQYYEYGLQLDSKLHLNYQRIAEIMILRNNLPQADDMIRKALSLNRNVADYHLTYARVLIKKRGTDLAKKEVKLALSLDPDSAVSYEIMAEIMKQEGRNDAATHFSKVAMAKKRLNAQ